MELAFNLRENFFCFDNRRFILSFFKKSLTEYRDGMFFDKFYSKDMKDNEMKKFSFAVNFNIDSIDKKNKVYIINDKKIFVTLDCESKRICVILANAFIGQMFKDFKLKNNSMRLVGIREVETFKIIGDEIDFKLKSHLIVRNGKENNNLYSLKDKEYDDELKKLISLKYDVDVSDIEVDTSGLHFTYVNFYNRNVKSALGTVTIKADRNLLNRIYHGGIGSCISSGFGFLDIEI